MPKIDETNETSTTPRELTPFERVEQRRRERKILQAILEETQSLVTGLDLVDEIESLGVDRGRVEELIDQKIIDLADMMRDRFGMEA